MPIERMPMDKMRGRHALRGHPLGALCEGWEDYQNGKAMELAS